MLVSTAYSASRSRLPGGTLGRHGPMALAKSPADRLPRLPGGTLGRHGPRTAKSRPADGTYWQAALSARNNPACRQVPPGRRDLLAGGTFSHVTTPPSPSPARQTGPTARPGLSARYDPAVAKSRPAEMGPTGRRDFQDVTIPQPPSPARQAGPTFVTNFTHRRGCPVRSPVGIFLAMRRLD